MAAPFLPVPTSHSQGAESTSTTEGSWLVILNNTLADSELHRLLKMQQLRIKG